MKKILYPIMALTLVLSIASSCNSSVENVENAQADVDTANKDLQQAKEALAKDIENYKSEMTILIAENKETINKLKVNLDQQSPLVKEERLTKISELENRNANMEEKIINYNVDSKDNWEKFKVEFNQDMNSIKEAIQGLNATN